jgi:hypothetical protein
MAISSIGSAGAQTCTQSGQNGVRKMDGSGQGMKRNMNSSSNSQIQTNNSINTQYNNKGSYAGAISSGFNLTL